MSVPVHLTANLENLDIELLLSDWRWLLTGSFTPIVMTVFGDLFLSDQAGNVHFLDVMSGEFKLVAASLAEFDRLCSDNEQRRNWFAGFLVVELRKLHGELGPGECFGCKIPFFLGGKLEADNFERTQTAVHYSMLGQLCRQTKQLPPGAKIDRIEIERKPEDATPTSWWQRVTNWTQ